MLDARIRPTGWQTPTPSLFADPTLMRDLSRVTYTVLKRTIDIVVSAGLLLLLAPLFLVMALAIRLDSAGPVIYIQRRGGRDGRIFDFYKFRSMTNGSDHTQEHRKFAQAYINGQSAVPHSGDEDRPIYKPASNGHSITRVGRWLRRTSLDELPQLVNILKGDMSLVGPRPSIDYEVAMYTDYQRSRLAVVPGLTGWAQINGRSSLSFNEIVRLDIEYIAQRSLRMDLAILLATVPLVVRAKDVG